MYQYFGFLSQFFSTRRIFLRFAGSTQLGDGSSCRVFRVLSYALNYTFIIYALNYTRSCCHNLDICSRRRCES